VRLVAFVVAVGACGGAGMRVDQRPTLAPMHVAYDNEAHSARCGDGTVKLPAAIAIADRSDAVFVATLGSGVVAIRAWPLPVNDDQAVFEWRELHERVAGELPHEIVIRGAARSTAGGAVVDYDAGGAMYRYAYGTNDDATCTIAALERKETGAELVDTVVPLDTLKWTYGTTPAGEPLVAIRGALRSLASENAAQSR
jgi:hypothetical protein